MIDHTRIIRTIWNTKNDQTDDDDTDGGVMVASKRAIFFMYTRMGVLNGNRGSLGPGLGIRVSGLKITTRIRSVSKVATCFEKFDFMKQSGRLADNIFIG